MGKPDAYLWTAKDGRQSVTLGAEAFSLDDINEFELRSQPLYLEAPDRTALIADLVGALASQANWLRDTSDYLAKIPGLYASTSAHRDREKELREVLARAKALEAQP